jgi:O-antigen ligase
MSHSGAAATLRAPQVWNADPARAASGPPQVGSATQSSALGFYLFILVNAVLFIRPSEIIPELLGVNLYEMLIVVCLAVSLMQVIGQLVGQPLFERPITCCLLGFWVAIILSELWRGDLGEAKDWAKDFGKLIIYYLLFLVNVNTLVRLRQFLTWLVIFIVVVTVIGVFQYHGWISIPQLLIYQQKIRDEYGNVVEFTPRLMSTGIYQDPNDLSMILQVCMIICFYEMDARRSALARLTWICPFVLFAYGLMLTQSRGGFIGFVAGVMTLLALKLGRKRTLKLSVVLLPALLIVFGGRQTEINVTDKNNTAQARIQIWSDGLDLFKTKPICGIGAGTMQDEVGHVAHNSFVHTLVECGIIGGTWFVGLFLAALWGAWRLRPYVQAPEFDPELRRMWPYVITLVACYGTSMLSLSRAYVAPSYMIFGVVASFIQLACESAGIQVLRFDSKFVVRMIQASVAVLIILIVWVKIFARFGSG